MTNVLGKQQETLDRIGKQLENLNLGSNPTQINSISQHPNISVPLSNYPSNLPLSSYPTPNYPTPDYYSPIPQNGQSNSIQQASEILSLCKQMKKRQFILINLKNKTNFLEDTLKRYKDVTTKNTKIA